MREESVARRYAAALFHQAQTKGTLSEAYRDLQIVGQTVSGTRSLRAILNQPLLSEEKKKAAVRSVFEKSISAPTLGFLNLLIDKRRIDILDAVIAEFMAQVRAYQNIEVATATTAVPLTAEQGAALVRSLEARTGKKIELTASVDPAVIGGVLVRIGDTVFDGTVRGNLDRLRERLLARQ
jgi:F-type H+-transporting ATPase subunit delta